MSEHTQQEGINAARNLLDDGYTSKFIFQFKPLIGVLDGVNKTFQIPQERIVNDVSLAPLPIIYKNKVPLIYTTDWAMLNSKAGTLQIVAAPTAADAFSMSCYYIWFDDVEWDSFLNRGAGLVGNDGFNRYYTKISGLDPTSFILGTQISGSVYANDIPDGLYGPLASFAGAYAARALALRFSTRYDTSAGDQSFSPSQMSTAFEKIADGLYKQALADRDDYYKGQGAQFMANASKVAYRLPNWTPKR